MLEVKQELREINNRLLDLLHFSKLPLIKDAETQTSDIKSNEKFCHYCEKSGHNLRNCRTLKRNLGAQQHRNHQENSQPDSLPIIAPQLEFLLEDRIPSPSLD